MQQTTPCAPTLLPKDFVNQPEMHVDFEQNWSNWTYFLAQGVMAFSIVYPAWRLRSYSTQTAQPSGPFSQHLGRRASVDLTRNPDGIVVGAVLSFEVPHARRFNLRREGLFDRLSKGLHLTDDAHAADERFDRHFFVDTQDEPFLQLLRSRNDLRVGLFKLSLAFDCKTMTCENGWLRARLGSSFIAYGEGLESALLASFTPLLEALHGLPADEARAGQRPRRARTALPFAMALGFVLIGFLTLNFLHLFASDQLLEPYKLFRFSLILACVATVAYVLWANHRASNSANRHRWLLAWLFLAAPGIVMLSFIAVRSANALFDRAPAEPLAVTDVEIHLADAKRRGETRSLSFRSEHPRLRYFSSAAIDRETYDRLKTAWSGERSARATILLHPGALGFEWAQVER